jgi:hypothetical protein
VGALVEAVVRPPAGAARAVDEASLARTQQVMLRRLRMMPRYLGIPMMLLTVLFDAWGILRRGRPFHAQTLEERRAQMAAWRAAPFNLARSFVDFYDRMASFIYFSDLEEKAAHPSPEAAPAP